MWVLHRIWVEQKRTWWAPMSVRQQFGTQLWRSTSSDQIACGGPGAVNDGQNMRWAGRTALRRRKRMKRGMGVGGARESRKPVSKTVSFKTEFDTVGAPVEHNSSVAAWEKEENIVGACPPIDRARSGFRAAISAYLPRSPALTARTTASTTCSCNTLRVKFTITRVISVPLLLTVIRAAPPNGLDRLNIDKFHQYLAYRSETRTHLVVLGSISINYATSHATSPIDTISSFLDDARVPHLEADIKFRYTHGDGNEWEAVISYRPSEESPCCASRTCVAIGCNEMPAGPAGNFAFRVFRIVVSEKALLKITSAALVAPSAALEPLMGSRSAAVETHVPLFISSAALPDRAPNRKTNKDRPGHKPILLTTWCTACHVSFFFYKQGRRVLGSGFRTFIWTCPTVQCPALFAEAVSVPRLADASAPAFVRPLFDPQMIRRAILVEEHGGPRPNRMSALIA
ncbi:hypothetical protein DFH06DRAFT_1133365 [Mycena polygramma]|nr:hypothetical protein DFH06DRAFT_1133365 [Mycena polygramma]